MDQTTFDAIISELNAQRTILADRAVQYVAEVSRLSTALQEANTKIEELEKEALPKKKKAA